MNKLEQVLKYGKASFPTQGDLLSNIVTLPGLCTVFHCFLEAFNQITPDQHCRVGTTGVKSRKGFEGEVGKFYNITYLMLKKEKKYGEAGAK